MMFLLAASCITSTRSHFSCLILLLVTIAVIVLQPAPQPSWNLASCSIQWHSCRYSWQFSCTEFVHRQSSFKLHSRYSPPIGNVSVLSHYLYNYMTYSLTSLPGITAALVYKVVLFPTVGHSLYIFFSFGLSWCFPDPVDRIRMPAISVSLSLFRPLNSSNVSLST